MTMKIQTELLTFEDVAANIISEQKADREGFLEVIEGMKQLATENSETSIMMVEQIVKAYDVLNKMAMAKLGIANSILKSNKSVKDENENDDVFSEIGDINERMISGGEH